MSERNDSRGAAGEAADVRALHLLFAEVNEHLRANDMKQLHVSTGYFTLLAIAVSIMASRESLALSSWRTLLVYEILLAVGCTTIYIQDSYRSWKLHYRLKCHWLAHELRIRDPLLVPAWIIRPPFEAVHTFRLSPDNALTYFTALTTAVLFTVSQYILATLVDSVFLTVTLVVGGTVLYVAYISWIRWRGLRRKREIRQELEAEKRRRFPTRATVAA